MDNEVSEGIGSLRMSLRERKSKNARQKDELRFLDDFDPNSSNREKRKLKRKVNTNSRNSAYDEYGHIRHNGKDVCDCMNDDCPGCWNDCENCGSNRCGVQCRVNRKIYYESIAFDGKDSTIRNMHFPGK